MWTSPPASGSAAARKAALRMQFLMLPPTNSNRWARKSMSTSSARGVDLGMVVFQSTFRVSTSGNWNSTMNFIRRKKAGSMLCL